MKKPTKILEKLCVNSRCNNLYKKRTSTPVDIETKHEPAYSDDLFLEIEPIKNKKQKFRTIRRKSIIVGATTDICVAPDFTPRQ